MSIVRLALVLASVATPALAASTASAPVAAPVLTGGYLEVRTCDVYTGPCFAMAEVGAVGKEATLAWSIDRGAVAGVDLAGLAVAAVVQADATLGDPYADQRPRAVVLYLDERADEAQARALRGFAQARLGDLGRDITVERRARVDLAVGCCDKAGCATLTVGDEVEVSTRCVCEDDLHCGNEYVYYPPLTDGLDVVPAVATEHRIETDALHTRIIDRERRGAFTGTFSVGHAAGAVHVGAVLTSAVMARVLDPRADGPTSDGPTSDGPTSDGSTSDAADTGADVPRAVGGDDPKPAYRLVAVPAPEGEAAPVLPVEIPEAFAKRLDPAGLRLLGRDGAPIYDLWLRREVPAADPPTPGMRVEFRDLPAGEYVGVLRSYGKEHDYRESEVPKGFFSLRFGIQPEDGDHMGTSDTRDFLVLSSFAEDPTPDRVADMVDLGEMSILSSSTDHPLICYLVVPDGEAPAAPRIYRHAERDEWIADLAIRVRAEGADEPKKLRVGVVLIGVSEHF